MELAELIDIAYQRGCGSSTAAAKRTRRYQELRQQLGRPAHMPQRALVQHLGESLIAAADANLPLDLKRQAGRWQKQTIPQQAKSLEAVLGTLSADHWCKLRGKTKDELNDWGQGALPAECGSWNTGPHQPCCHGLGLMLMAWAKRTGAPHYWATGVQFTLMASMGVVLRQLNGIKRLIADELPEFEQQATGLKNWLRRCERSLYLDYDDNERFDFHAALVIQVKNGYWLVIDPYARAWNILYAKDGWEMGRAHRSLSHSRPERVVTVNAAGVIKDYERQWQTSRRLIARHLQRLRRRHLANPGHEHPFDVGNMVCRFMDSAAARKAGARVVTSPRKIAAYGLVAHRIKLSMDKTTPRQFQLAWNKTLHDETLRRLATQRAASWLPINWLWHTVFEGWNQLTSDMPYASLELAHPATAAATGTLNNLRCWLGSRPYSLDGDLLPYSESQILWHDHQLTKLAGRNLDARHQALLRDREAALRELPAISRHPKVQTLLDTLSARPER